MGNIMAYQRWLLGWIAPALVIMILGSGCTHYPQDPHHSLARVLAGKRLRVGVVNQPPWVIGQPPGAPGGAEAALVAAFADELGVSVQWHWGSAAAHFAALKRYELDIVIGGFTKTNPWQREVAFSLPYYTSRALVGLPPDAPSITRLAGVRVAVQPNSGLREPLMARGAIVLVQESLVTAQGPVAAEEWELLGMDFRPTELQLQSVDHVMAVPQGENALLMRLERFLLQQTTATSIAAQLWEAATE